MLSAALTAGAVTAQELLSVSQTRAGQKKGPLRPGMGEKCGGHGEVAAAGCSPTCPGESCSSSLNGESRVCGRTGIPSLLQNPSSRAASEGLAGVPVGWLGNRP